MCCSEVNSKKKSKLYIQSQIYLKKILPQKKNNLNFRSSLKFVLNFSLVSEKTLILGLVPNLPQTLFCLKKVVNVTKNCKLAHVINLSKPKLIFLLWKAQIQKWYICNKFTSNEI